MFKDRFEVVDTGPSLFYNSIIMLYSDTLQAQNWESFQGINYDFNNLKQFPPCKIVWVYV